VAEGKRRLLAVEKAKRDAFPVKRRHRRDANVDRAPAGRDGDAPVLWAAALGDVEMGEDLDAADNRRVKFLRRSIDRNQSAVDPVAHGVAMLEGLDVDVGSALLGGIVQELIDQANNRRFAREIAQAIDVRLVYSGSLGCGQSRRLLLAAIKAVEGSFHLGGHG